MQDADTNQTLADKSIIIKIEEYEERNVTYEICDTWSLSQSGGQGMTIDNWDIKMIPAGAVFDIRFQMWDNPDKLFIEYPVGNMVLDTGEKDIAAEMFYPPSYSKNLR